MTALASIELFGQFRFLMLLMFGAFPLLYIRSSMLAAPSSLCQKSEWYFLTIYILQKKSCFLWFLVLSMQIAAWSLKKIYVCAAARSLMDISSLTQL